MSNGIRRLARAWLFFLLLAGVAPAHAEPPVERLGVSGPLQLDGQAFHFVWSSHPYPHFYKQEYLPEGQTLTRYRQMLMIDVLLSDAGPRELTRIKLAELEARKAEDPVIQHDLIVKEDGSAYLLDFVVSGRTAHGELIVEWNAYRYEALPGGAVMLGISRRGYGDEGARRFLIDEMKPRRQEWISELARLDMPRIVPKAP
ncbi:hypothetical protein [Luteimonas sp. SDU101]|uniref:hypothetical protein n=1 Tax=Luteimonas sp. SDU101 TaxID=3422593 RepID=UPI003EB98076